jgi:hypothetical protein
MDGLAPDRASDNARIPMVPFNSANMTEGTVNPTSTPSTAPKNPSVIKSDVTTNVGDNNG